MAMSDNLDRLKAAYKVWHDTKGATQNGWLDLLADNVQIRSMDGESEALAFARPRRSKREAVDYFMAITRDWSMVHWTPHTFVCEGDKIAVFATCAWTHKGTKKTVETPTAQLWEFEDGKAVAVSELFDSAKVVAAATP